jgi:hypothetical protein
MLMSVWCCGGVCVCVCVCGMYVDGWMQLAAALSASTGKTVEYVQLPYDAVRASFIEKGWPAWQVGGLLELFRAVDAGAYGYGLGDYATITGKEPTTVAEFVEAVKGGFL